MQKQFPSIVAVEPSVDWLTMTVKNRTMRDAAKTEADKSLDEAMRAGDRVQIWNSFGFAGWDCGGLRWGRREKEDLIQLRSKTCATKWQDYAKFASNISRLDLAVTVKFAHHPIDVARSAFETIETVALDLPIMRNYSIITSLLGGDTLYVGKRSSNQYGRVYDKSQEERGDEFGNCWRWEVEVKKPLSQVVAERLSQAENKRSYISAWVKGWFEDRMVECPWIAEVAYNAIEILRAPTSDERSLNWLRSQVVPTVDRLVTRGRIVDLRQIFKVLLFE